MTGILIKLNDRPDIVFEDGTLYGGLHCGECLSIFEEKMGWIPVRLEFTDDWVLIDGGRAKTFPVPYGGCVMV